ncbi:hypothetical protein [Gluconobacter albidus]|uniref:Uncharacterized protein n=1 Tax=Gluconobacter albidus TaxID=318683 RepID=A0AAW3QY86_9PROT|nr:hypothetical protein [Gluconobacter albidus]KXV40251.1 hypothetical protein AD941_04550 [Gluconobacter albidus]GBQ90494.1 hypothetical protein AA3250_2064 [Gluconobacter albidus NBRC 3250]GLQ68911.1 hypothetical protein GCM10007866_13620 [Gluconobacter albidus]
MPIRNVLQFFHGEERPFFVDVPDIAKHILSYVSHHSIFYVEHEETEEPVPLEGMLEQQEITTGFAQEPTIADYIHLKKDALDPQRRVICAKELLHILDPSTCRTSDPKGLDQLIEDMGSSFDVFTDTSAPSAQDVGNLILASSIFISNDMRQRALEAINAGKLTMEAFAATLEVPLGVVRVVLREDWPKKLNEQMISLQRELDKEGDEEEEKYHREMEEYKTS